MSVTPAPADPQPPRLARRGLLQLSGLGVTSTLLPSASAAASIPETQPQAFSYGGTETPVAVWEPYDSAAASSLAASSKANGIREATLRLGGTTNSLDNANLGDPEISGRDGLFNGGVFRSAVFSLRNSSSTLDLADSPYLEFLLDVESGSLTLATLVLYSIRSLDSPGVKLAAYVSTDGWATATLRRTLGVSSALAPASQRHVVVNLGLSDRTFGQDETVAVRLYPYATAAASELRLAGFDSDPDPVAHTAVDTIRQDVVGTLSGSNRMAAFVGTWTAPPAP